MTNLSLHHIGIVVPNEEVFLHFCKVFNLQEDYRGYVAEYAALCIFMKGNGKSPIEFVIPNGGKLKEFNDGKGGLHHIAFETPSIAETKKEANYDK